MENKNTYDILPYYSKSFSFSAPIKQAAILKLLGFESKDIRNAKILELGCSYGGNIIPIALHFPNCEIVGVDLSKTQIEEGNKVIENIGLDNIKLMHKNILDIDKDFGTFDYIICHGVYSWVPEEVKDKILEILSNNLSENGSALISYNCYPGWKKHEVLKDVMKFRVRSLEELGYNIDEMTKTKIGLGAIEFLQEHSLLNDQLKEYAKELSSKNLYYIYHEYLETNNDPIYIYDFAKQLKKHKLMHVIDASLVKSILTLNNEQKELIKKECEGNHILQEQYLDFLRDTQFRKSIIIKEKNEEKVNLSDRVLKKDVEKMYVRAKYEFKDDKIYYHDELLNQDINVELIKFINETYPKTVSVKDLVEKFKDEAYNDIFTLIVLSKIEFYSFDLDIKISEKLKLKDKIVKYIDYFLENENPVIALSNFANNVLNYQELILRIFKLFDGTKTLKEIENLVFDSFEIRNKDDQNLKDEIKRIVMEISKVIISDMMNE